MKIENAFVFDIETYRNCFVLVARSLADPKTYLKFVVHDDRNDYVALKDWLKTKPSLIGFNNVGFDSQALELIWRTSKPVTPLEIYESLNELIKKRKEDRFYLHYNEWDLSFRHTDLFLINHYDNKRTSLKWLEFTMRSDKMQDLPIPFDAEVTKSNVTKVLSYCKNDVDKTYDFYHRCLPMITLREELAAKYNNYRIINMSDSSIGSFIMEHALLRSGIKKEQLQSKTYRKEIAIKDCLLPYISFSSEEFKAIYQVYQDRILEDVQTNGLKGAVEQQTTFKGVDFLYGSGGLHACTKPGVYESDDNYVILSVDVKSFYPRLSIVNNFYPEHIGKNFCKVYDDLYNERTKYQKGTAINYAIKIALNAVYGKSNNAFTIFYDPMYTLKITINGQLLLTMLAEELSNIGQILMCNTDGLEIRIPRDKMDEFKFACEQWESLTDLELEHATYSKMVIRDVNGYLAVGSDGKVKKRKNLFRTYYDFTEEDGKEHSYDENPSGLIIADALNAYYVDNIPVEQYINECNNIYPFLYGIKKQEKFDYLLFTADDAGIMEVETRTERAIRFFVKKKGANVFKFWKDGRKNYLQKLKKGHLVETAMSIKKGGEIITTIKGNQKKETSVIVNYEPDRDYYIQECYKVIQGIEQGKVYDEITIEDDE